MPRPAVRRETGFIQRGLVSRRTYASSPWTWVGGYGGTLASQGLCVLRGCSANDPPRWAMFARNANLDCIHKKTPDKPKQEHLLNRLSHESAAVRCGGNGSLGRGSDLLQDRAKVTAAKQEQMPAGPRRAPRGLRREMSPSESSPRERGKCERVHLVSCSPEGVVQIGLTVTSRKATTGRSAAGTSGRFSPPCDHRHSFQGNFLRPKSLQHGALK